MSVLTIIPKSDVNVEGPFTLTFDLNGLSENATTGTSIVDGILLEENTSYIIRHKNPIRDICKLISIEDDISYTQTIFSIYKSFRYSSNQRDWSDWAEYSAISEIEAADEFFIEFRYLTIQENYSTSGSFYDTPILKNVKLKGEIFLNRVKAVTTLTYSGECVILCPPGTWKVFELKDFIVTSEGETEDRYLEIKFRLSTSSGKKWTNWCFLTAENLQNVDFDPLRFFFIELSVCRKGIDEGEIKLYDIEIIGEIYNINEDYTLFNRFGLRTDCNDKYLNGECDDDVDGTKTPKKLTFEDLLKEGTNPSCNNEKLFNPYNTKPVEIANVLANQAAEIFGWNVDYYRTDPDNNGRDFVLHEYQLKNIVQQENIKILVPKNNFPDVNLSINIFNLELHDSFEIHITRDEFKKYFGVHIRPSKWDLVFLCERNALYQVSHVIAEKNYLHASIYYKVMLQKAEDNQHIRRNDPSVANSEEIDQNILALTKNSSLDSIFGNDVKKDTERVVDKKLQHTHTDNLINRQIHALTKITDEPIYNGPNIISKNYYKLTNVANNQVAVQYENVDRILGKGDDRSFIIWFRLESNISGNIYNLFSNQSVINNTPYGYLINYSDSRIDIEWNEQFFEIYVPMVNINTWYAMVLNMNQCNQQLEFTLYRRKSDTNPQGYSDPTLNIVHYETHDLTPVEFNVSNDLQIKGSAINISNIRIFDCIILPDKIQNILQEYIVKDTQYLVFADNATKDFNLTRYLYRTKENNKI